LIGRRSGERERRWATLGFFL